MKTSYPPGNSTRERSDATRGAVSLDRFLAGIDGSIEWPHFSRDVQQIAADYGKNVDTILMGRKTSEVAVAQHPPGGKIPKSAKRRTKSEPATRTYVFSGTLKSIDANKASPLHSRATSCPKPHGLKPPLSAEEANRPTGGHFAPRTILGNQVTAVRSAE